MSLSFNFMGGASRYKDAGWRNMHNLHNSRAEHLTDHHLPPKNLSYSSQVHVQLRSVVWHSITVRLSALCRRTGTVPVGRCFTAQSVGTPKVWALLSFCRPALADLCQCGHCQRFWSYFASPTSANWFIEQLFRIPRSFLVSGSRSSRTLCRHALCPCRWRPVELDPP